jgi:toxin YoeB
MRRVAFESKAFDDFTSWASEDKKIHRKIIGLIKEVQRDPFVGTGKPEPLKHDLKGYWSRRIDQEHRLIYTVTDDAVVIISCKYHYK